MDGSTNAVNVGASQRSRTDLLKCDFNVLRGDFKRKTCLEEKTVRAGAGLRHGACNALGGCDCDPVYVGENCTLPPGVIPTGSEWGLVVLTLLPLTAGKLAFGRGSQRVAS